MLKHVLGDVLGVFDWVLRNEYQSRKVVHWHILGRMIGISLTDIEIAFKSYKFDDQLGDKTEENGLAEGDCQSDDDLKVFNYSKNIYLNIFNFLNSNTVYKILNAIVEFNIGISFTK